MPGCRKQAQVSTPLIGVSATSHLQCWLSRRHFLHAHKGINERAFGLGGIGLTGRIPEFINRFSRIDRDTPQDVYSTTSWADRRTPMRLVFSDEFNTDGRAFYPGDDLY